MAKRTFLVDDLDGSDAVITARFGLDGIEYEIDLSETNMTQMKTLMASYIEAGRVASTPGRQPRRTPNRSSETARVRQWAREQGHNVSAKGRLPQPILDAWAEREQ